MFYNQDLLCFCLNCSSSFSLKEYKIIEIKSFIFSLGGSNIKCPVCKSKDNFISLTPSWTEIISKLDSKGFQVLDCSMFYEKENNSYAYIKFQKPLKSTLKPKIMKYDTNWAYKDSSIIKKSEDPRILIYSYTEKGNYFKEYQKLTKNLLSWSENI